MSKIIREWLYDDCVMTAMFKKAVDQSVQSKIKKGVPVAKYDLPQRKAYLEYSDGRKEYIEN